MGVWFKTKDEIDWSVFKTWFYLTHGVASEQMAVFNAIFDKLQSTPIPDDSVLGPLLQDFITKNYTMQIVEHGMEILDGKHDKIVQIGDMLREWEADSGVATSRDQYFVEDDISAIISNTYTHAYEWRLPFFNQAIGPLHEDMLVIVAGTPDCGKTTLLSSEVSYIAGQLPDEKMVLWINNEQQGRKVKKRVVQSGLGITNTVLEANHIKAATDIAKLWGRPDKVRVYNKPHVTVEDIEGLLRDYDVGLIVFDQLWKVHGFDDAGDVAKQERLAQWARELSKQYGPVLDAHQADSSAYGQMYIGMDQLYRSKVGLPGEADVIVTIGRTNEPGMEEVRGIYVPKNKEQGSDPSQVNGRYEAEIQRDIGRFV